MPFQHENVEMFMFPKDIAITSYVSLFFCLSLHFISLRHTDCCIFHCKHFTYPTWLAVSLQVGPQIEIHMMNEIPGFEYVLLLSCPRILTTGNCGILFENCSMCNPVYVHLLQGRRLQMLTTSKRERRKWKSWNGIVVMCNVIQLVSLASQCFGNKTTNWNPAEFLHYCEWFR